MPRYSLSPARLGTLQPLPVPGPHNAAETRFLALNRYFELLAYSRYSRLRVGLSSGGRYLLHDHRLAYRGQCNVR